MACVRASSRCGRCLLRFDLFFLSVWKGHETTAAVSRRIDRASIDREKGGVLKSCHRRSPNAVDVSEF